MKTNEVNIANVGGGMGASKHLQVLKPDTKTIMAQGQEMANVLMEVVEKQKLYKQIGPSKHIKFEAWQIIARFNDIVASSTQVEQVLNPKGDIIGAKCRANAVKFSTGEILTEATAYCMFDEPNWKSKPFFQLASMAQTRAGAKVLKMIFSWIVTLAGYSATPAEEMDEVQRDNKNGPEYFCTFGKNKGVKWTDMKIESLEWYINTLEKSKADPEKVKWKEYNEKAYKGAFDAWAEKSKSVQDQAVKETSVVIDDLPDFDSNPNKETSDGNANNSEINRQ